MASSNAQLSLVVAASTDRRWCQSCNAYRPAATGVERPTGNRHGTVTKRWFCAGCNARRRPPTPIAA
jgi:hypothetical protein